MRLIAGKAGSPESESFEIGITTDQSSWWSAIHWTELRKEGVHDLT